MWVPSPQLTPTHSIRSPPPTARWQAPHLGLLPSDDDAAAPQLQLSAYDLPPAAAGQVYLVMGPNGLMPMMVGPGGMMADPGGLGPLMPLMGECVAGWGWRAGARAYLAREHARCHSG